MFKDNPDFIIPGLLDLSEKVSDKKQEFKAKLMQREALLFTRRLAAKSDKIVTTIAQKGYFVWQNFIKINDDNENVRSRLTPEDRFEVASVILAKNNLLGKLSAEDRGSSGRLGFGVDRWSAYHLTITEAHNQ